MSSAILSTCVEATSDDDVTATPTDAELDTAFGDATTHPDGYMVLIDDNGGGSTVHLVIQKNDKWFMEALTAAS